MPMGIGPGLSVTRFESGIPGWMTGMDLGWDFTQNVQYIGATNPTDTHSATIYAQSAAGVWSPFAANTLVRTDLGLQTVPTRTNSIRNNSMVGAVAGVIGSGGALPTNWQRDTDAGLTYTIATGTAFGLPYIDIRFAGTTATTFTNILFESNTSTVAANGETWASSWFYTLVGGSLANVFVANGIVERTSAGAYITGGTEQTVTPTAAFQRAAVPRTLSGGATVARVNSLIGLRYSSGVAIDITLRIYAPQMELGAFASAPILTTSGAATVNGNQQVVDLTGRLGSGVGGVFQFVFRGSIVNITHPIVLNDNSASNSVGFTWLSSGNKLIFSVEVGGLGQGSVDVIASPVDGATYTVAFAAQQGYAMAAAIAQTAPTPVSPASWPPSMRQVVFGGLGSNASRNVYQVAKRGALRFGPQNASTFADLFAKATILAAVS